jgi:AP-2 complex subunit sigma-1
MIRFLLLQNRAGKTRLAKYYVPLGDHEKRKLEYDVHRLIVTRDPKHTNFAEVRWYPPKQLLLPAATLLLL